MFCIKCRALWHPKLIYVSFALPPPGGAGERGRGRRETVVEKRGMRQRAAVVQASKSSWTLRRNREAVQGTPGLNTHRRSPPYICASPPPRRYGPRGWEEFRPFYSREGGTQRGRERATERKPERARKKERERERIPVQRRSPGGRGPPP